MRSGGRPTCARAVPRAQVARGSQCVVWVYNSYGAYCWGLGRCLALMRVISSSPEQQPPRHLALPLKYPQPAQGTAVTARHVGARNSLYSKPYGSIFPDGISSWLHVNGRLAP